MLRSGSVPRPWRFAALALLAVVPFAPPPAAAPEPAAATGSVQGRVLFPNGDPVPGATVLVVGTSLASGTDRRGFYRLEQVPAGTWTLRVTAFGRAPFDRAGVRVAAGRVTRTDLVLMPAAVDSSIADAGALATLRRDEARRRTAQEAFAPARTPMAAVAAPPAPGGYAAQAGDFNTEEYRHIRDNRFLTVRANPLSTFAIDVDAASYANVRRFLTQGQLPPADAVRVEELVNYFPYSYRAPTGEDPFSLTTAVMPAPWARGHQLVLVGVQGRTIEADHLPPSNLVFLLDVSGSMESPDKLPLVKRAFRLLVEQLRPQDRVAIVVYAGAAGVVLPPTTGSEKATILDAIDRLQAGGSTAGGEGIRLAYRLAREHLMPEGNNRVILATDGDFNVGVSSEGDLVRMIEQEKRAGIYLTVLGFGTGNLKDAKMEALADKGNGHYAYVDDILEARKVFVQELGATLVTIAKDVKVQVEFNPAKVAEYRLVGYENRLLAAEDFNDDTKDGGELGAGHSVTAIYEIVPAGASTGQPGVDPLKYQDAPAAPVRGGSDELLTVKLRYQPPMGGGPSRLVQRAVRPGDRADGTTLGDFRFAAAVAEFGMLLRQSEFRGTASWEQVATLARQGLGADEGGYRAEFVRLVGVARSLAPVEEARASGR